MKVDTFVGQGLEVEFKKQNEIKKKVPNTTRNSKPSTPNPNQRAQTPNQVLVRMEKEKGSWLEKDSGKVHTLSTDSDSVDLQ